MIFIVSSIAASGKTTLVDYVVEKFGLYRLKTCTTRPVREEENGDEYFFMCIADFLDKVANGNFIEYANVYDEFYGLTNEEAENNKEKHCIIILDVKGTKTMLELFPEATSIFILPPPFTEIQKRLEARNTGSADINRRLDEMSTELLESEKYEYRIKYGELDDMKAEITDIINLEINS